ncbi:MAG: RnfH family protein [Gammaproteobacteria bacterium]|nr:RnfH family protein [Gammaproteobacteria bacterium]
MAKADASSAGAIAVEVAYARPDIQRLIELIVPAQTSVREALELSGIGDGFDEIDTATCAVGVFGRAVDDDYVLRPGDRIEIYRPLHIDPRAARRARAANS